MQRLRDQTLRCRPEVDVAPKGANPVVLVPKTTPGDVFVAFVEVGDSIVAEVGDGRHRRRGWGTRPSVAVLKSTLPSKLANLVATAPRTTQWDILVAVVEVGEAAVVGIGESQRLGTTSSQRLGDQTRARSHDLSAPSLLLSLLQAHRLVWADAKTETLLADAQGGKGCRFGPCWIYGGHHYYSNCPKRQDAKCKHLGCTRPKWACY